MLPFARLTLLICRVFDVRLEQMRGRQWDKGVVRRKDRMHRRFGSARSRPLSDRARARLARFVLWYLGKHLLGRTLHELGRMICSERPFDHTTVYNGQQRAANSIRKDVRVAERVEEVLLRWMEQ